MSDVAGKDVDRNDAQQFGGALVGILNQSVLHDAHEGVAVGGDCQTFHAFIGHATGGVAGNFHRAHRRQGVHVEVCRQLERAKAHAEQAVELIHVRTVFVGDEDAPAIIGKAHPFGVEAGIVGIAGVMVGIEVIGTSGEEVLEKVVDPRRARADEGVTGAVNKGSEAPEQGGGA